MCSILGATIFDETSVEIWNRAKDRGRDYSGMSQYGNSWIANHRATPTNEIDKAIRNQPFGKGFKVVHNGTIANDMELGNEANSIDSEILTQILNTETLLDYRDWETDRKSTRLNSSHSGEYRMPSTA